MSKVDIDELVRWRDQCEALAASLQRKVRHCDEITEERDKALRERDEARSDVERLEAQHLERHLESWEQHMQDNDVKRAYRRGAEAMRLACQEWCRARQTNGEAMADALADLRVEDKP